MRKLVVSEFVSLDGVMENPMWTFQFGSEEQQNYKFLELKESDALLLGRVTYEGFAAAWPNMIEQTGEYGVMMNGYPKYVVSTTLQETAWNNSILIQDDFKNAVLRLKEQPGRDILVFGSCSLANALTELDLVDEYRLMVFPIALGKGKRLFDDASSNKVMELTETKTFDSGVVVLTYRPVRN